MRTEPLSTEPEKRTARLFGERDLEFEDLPADAQDCLLRVYEIALLADLEERRAALEALAGVIQTVSLMGLDSGIALGRLAEQLINLLTVAFADPARADAQTYRERQRRARKEITHGRA